MSEKPSIGQCFNSPAYGPCEVVDIYESLNYEGEFAVLVHDEEGSAYLTRSFEDLKEQL